MSDDNIASFVSITSASTAQAEQYLRLSDGDLEQAIQLFFENPDLASSLAGASTFTPQPQTQPSRTAQRPQRRQRVYEEDEDGVIHIDSDDDNDVGMDVDEDDDIEMVGANTIQRQLDAEADAEMARQLQEELYAGRGTGADDVRAPIERTRETLVGEDDFDSIHATIQDRLRLQRQGQGRPGIFNQIDTQSVIWIDDPTAASSSTERNLSLATGGASERSTKAMTLAEMFRPPFDLISHLSFDVAREEGKEKEKWLLVNIQDPSVFDCQVLNRDLWKNKDIKDVVKEHFIFLQFSCNDFEGKTYGQYYLPNSRYDPNAYPHIAIVDPRTGEQVKVWSGAPTPTASDFLMQLYEFLDRYSLSEDARNPVAKRKADRKDLTIDRMTEEQMLEMALQNSLANDAAGKSAHEDPDDLTRSITLDKGKTKASDSDSGATATNEAPVVSPFASIPSDVPHVEPESSPAATRIQFRYSGGRIIRRFALEDPVQRIYEWLKAEPLQDKQGQEFDLIFGGKNLIDSLSLTIEAAGLKNASVMVEFLGGDD